MCCFELLSDKGSIKHNLIKGVCGRVRFETAFSMVIKFDLV